MNLLSSYLNKLRLFNRDVRFYLISWAIIGFNHMGIITVLFNLYLLRLGHGPKFVGMINGAAWSTYSGACLLAGTLGRRWSNRTLMVTGMAIIALGTAIMLVAERLPPHWQTGWILFFYSLTWVGAALYMVSSMPFLASATKDDERNHAFAIRTALNNVSGLAGSLVAGILPGVFATIMSSSLDAPAPYRYPLWIAFGLYVVATAMLLAIRKSETAPSIDKGNQDSGLQDTAKKPAPYGLIALLTIVMLLTSTGGSTIQNFFNIYMDAELAVPVITIGVLSAVKQLLSVLLALSAPLVMARWGKDRTIVFGFLMRSLSLVPIALIPQWAGAGLGYIMSVSMMSLTLPSFGVYQQESVSPRWRVTMSGAINTATGLSGAIMAYIGGYVISFWGYRELFLLSALFVAIGSLLFWGHTLTRKNAIS